MQKWQKWQIWTVQWRIQSSELDHYNNALLITIWLKWANLAQLKLDPIHYYNKAIQLATVIGESSPNPICSVLLLYGLEYKSKPNSCFNQSDRPNPKAIGPIESIPDPILQYETRPIAPGPKLLAARSSNTQPNPSPSPTFASNFPALASLLN